MADRRSHLLNAPIKLVSSEPLISVKLYLDVELASLNRTCSHHVYLLTGTGGFDCESGRLAVRRWIGSLFARGRVIRHRLPVSHITLHSWVVARFVPRY
jgi:hypothetical protein